MKHEHGRLVNLTKVLTSHGRSVIKQTDGLATVKQYVTP